MGLQDIQAAVADAIRLSVGLKLVASTQATVDLGSAAAEANTLTAIAVTGALPGDFALVAPRTDDLFAVNAGIYAVVSDDDEVAVNVVNNNAAGGAAIDIASAVYDIVVLRRA